MVDKGLKKINKELELICKAEWELNNPMSRLRIDRKNPSCIAQWK